MSAVTRQKNIDVQQDLRTLDQLPIGENAVVHRLDCGRRVGCRLMEMGLLPGTHVEMIRRAPFGDPIEIRLRGYFLSLRCDDASGISVTQNGESESFSVGTSFDIAQPLKPHSVKEERLDRVLRVLVAGNANAGKTTVFNVLTGARAKVGNYPGVTVSRASRVITLPSQAKVEVVDLPGIYSLSTHSPDEQVAVDEVLGRRGNAPDTVLVVLDACALERSLYLAMQIIETGVPTVVAVNMVDEAARAGIDINFEKMSKWLGVTAVPTVASAGQGLDVVREELDVALGQAARFEVGWEGFPESVTSAIAVIEGSLEGVSFVRTPASRRAWALCSLLSQFPDGEGLDGLPSSVRQNVDKVHREAKLADLSLAQDAIAARYQWIETVVADSKSASPIASETRNWTELLDGILTHRVYGLSVFAIVMVLLFEALFTWSEPLIAAIESLTGGLQSVATGFLPDGVFEDLVVNGVIAGVGNVIVFVPQIAMLFLFIAVLEDFGYLARVAFVIDRLMGRIGLHGKAFVPMLSGFACAIPAVMATRTIESRRDRLITMLTLPMVSCSARLPIYVLVTAVVFAGDGRFFGLFSTGAVVLFSMYALSVIATLGAAAVLRRTILKGPRFPLVLELPPYRVPVWRNVLLTTWRGLRRFLVDAGTIILAMTIILWALLSFPRSGEIVERYTSARADLVASIPNPNDRDDALRLLDGRESGEQLRHSVAGRIGLALEPLIEPLGYDWRIGVGILGAFAAREVFISTLGIVFGIADADEENVSLRSSLQGAQRRDGSPLMTPLAGVSLMVFFVLACQCMSTIGVVRRESGSWRWPIFMFTYMTILAYGSSLFVYQLGSFLGWGT